MKESNSKASHFETLRKQAEQYLDEKGARPLGIDQTDLVRLVNELEVYQVELEIQNEELRQSAKRLEGARNLYFDLYDAAPVGFVTLDQMGCIARYNRCAEQMLAGDGTPLAGRPFLGWLHDEDRVAYLSHLKSLSKNDAAAPCEVRLRRRDGAIRHVLLEAAASRDPEKERTLWRLTLVDITERKEHEKALCTARDALETRVQERTAELERRAAQLARLTHELTTAEQRERRRLAERLHDNLQQLLAGARIHLEMLSEEPAVARNPSYQHALELLMESIRASRSLASELSPPVLFQKGIKEAIEWLARWMEKTHRLTVEFALDEDVPPIPEGLRILLFQAVRELLFNVVKHAGADAARVAMTCRDRRIEIVVSDRGAGFDPDALQKDDAAAAGYGIFTLRERLKLLGGGIAISSTPERGTKVTLTAPMETADDALSGDTTKAPGHNRRQTDRPQQRLTANAGKIRVLLVDDHAVMRDGLSTMLSRHPDITVAGEAADGDEAVAMARQTRPDVILMDINMPKMNGLEATRIIHAEMPDIRIIGLSMHDAEDQASAMKEAGATDYLNKSGSSDALIAAIRRDEN